MMLLKMMKLGIYNNAERMKMIMKFRVLILQNSIRIKSKLNLSLYSGLDNT